MGKTSGEQTSQKSKGSPSKIIKSSWLGKTKKTQSSCCKKLENIKNLTDANCVICRDTLSKDNVMLPKCQHYFCRICIESFIHRNAKSSVQMMKLTAQKIVSDYIDLRHSPMQTPVDFFYNTPYSASLFHTCNVDINGRLASGKVRMTEKMRREFNLNQAFLRPLDVVKRMLDAACTKEKDPCTYFYRLIRVYAFDCPICRYHHSNVRLSDLQKSRLCNQILKEFRQEEESKADSRVDEGTSQKQPTTVDTDIEFDEVQGTSNAENAAASSTSSQQRNELRTFRQGLHVALYETDDEESLPPLAPPEDEELEEVEDAVVPENSSNFVETPPPSPGTPPAEMEINESQEGSDIEGNAPRVETERDEQLPSRAPSPGKFNSLNMLRIPRSMLHL